MLRCLIYICLYFISSSAAAIDFYVQQPAEQLNSDYEAKLLRIALDHAPGDHRLVYVDIDYSQGRAFRELADGTAPINILYSGYSRARETKTRMIYIPLTRGLLGNRMFLIHRKSARLFDKITTVKQLAKRITIGVGTTRPEEIILPSAGFSIVRSPGNQLIPMLLRGRFTSLIYGLDEIDLVYKDVIHREGGVDIIINETALLSYPFDSFFFVAPGDKERAKIVELGLKSAYASGAFMKHFETFPPIQAGLALMKKHNPRIFSIENPDLSDEVRAIPAEYWHIFD